MEKIINYGFVEFSHLADRNKEFLENIKLLERKKIIKSVIYEDQSVKIEFLDDFIIYKNNKKIKKENLTKILCEYDFRKIFKKRCLKCLS